MCTAIPTANITGNPIPPADSLYPFTTTLLGGEVEQYESSTVVDYGGFAVIECAGATAIIATQLQSPCILFKWDHRVSMLGR
jgi:hypothetical protein